MSSPLSIDPVHSFTLCPGNNALSVMGFRTQRRVVNEAITAIFRLLHQIPPAFDQGLESLPLHRSVFNLHDRRREPLQAHYIASHGALEPIAPFNLELGDLVRVPAYFRILLVRGEEDGIARPVVSLAFDSVVRLAPSSRLLEVCHCPSSAF